KLMFYWPIRGRLPLDSKPCARDEASRSSSWDKVDAPGQGFTRFKSSKASRSHRLGSSAGMKVTDEKIKNLQRMVVNWKMSPLSLTTQS
ncbi:uncharacterized protein PGTG_20386, partial [Puccinia graminis f. sp. tritici CRL 75-36-700-3]